MIWQIEVGGRVRQVELRGSDVILDGERMNIEVAQYDGGFSILVPAGPDPDGAVCGRSYDVSVTERGSDELQVYVNGRACLAKALTPGRSTRVGSDARPSTAGGPQKVVAPMPGRITKVLVKLGDTVAARQGLVVVEAMKMENELRSSRAGVVVDVRAVEGARVESNAVLVVVE